MPGLVHSKNNTEAEKTSREKKQSATSDVLDSTEPAVSVASGSGDHAVPVSRTTIVLDTPSVVAQSRIREETTFCGSESSRKPQKNSPSIHLNELCPECFPLTPPQVVKR